MAEQIKRLERNLVANGVIFDYYQDTVQLPNGKTAKWDLIDHVGAAAVVAVRKDGKVLLVRQYRNAPEEETLEIPAGGLNYRGEPKDQAAARELKEETGYETEKLEHLVDLYTAAAYCTEVIGIYLAEGLERQGSQHLDENEFLNVEAYTLEELLSMIRWGQIHDSKTVSGILLYAQRVYERQGKTPETETKKA